MADKYLRLRVFVASPSDTYAERAAIRSIVDELNIGLADDLAIDLEVVRWETHSWPAVGHDAQDIINQQMATPDIVIGIFWKRLGTATPRALSGTVEEIETALDLRSQGHRIEVLVYFNQAAYTLRRDELDQITSVLDFRQDLERRGLLIGTYEGLEDFRSKIRIHLTQVIRRWAVQPDPTTRRTDLRSRTSGQVQEQALREETQLWHDQLAAGRVSAEIDPHSNRQLHRFITATSAALSHSGFDARTCSRATTILVELTSNVARHAEGNSFIEIVAEKNIFKNVSISVASRNKELSIQKIVNGEVAHFEAGEQEHGLMHASRLSDEIGTSVTASGLAAVHCAIYQPSLPDSVLYGSPAIAPIRFVYRYPRFLWVGENSYSGSALQVLRGNRGRVQELFLGALAAEDKPWLVLEYTDDVFPTVPSDREYRDELDTIDAIVRSYFKDMISQQRVIVVAHETTYSVKYDCSLWAQSHGLRFFDSESGFANWLAAQSPG
jgi:anti-sigma regulatory factor (Ser/Thr protein kinase)